MSIIQFPLESGGTYQTNTEDCKNDFDVEELLDETQRIAKKKVCSVEWVTQKYSLKCVQTSIQVKITKPQCFTDWKNHSISLQFLTNWQLLPIECWCYWCNVSFWTDKNWEWNLFFKRKLFVGVQSKKLFGIFIQNFWYFSTLTVANTWFKAISIGTIQLYLYHIHFIQVKASIKYYICFIYTIKNIWMWKCLTLPNY